MGSFTLNIITPEKEVLKEAVDFLAVPGKEGELGITAGHINFITALTAGEVKVKQRGGEKTFKINSGFLHVAKEKVVLLAKGLEEGGAEDGN
ncbi:MAG: ATP synthase F1 subunit epsilon [Candidatus Omnitrophica bacterium CG11_big_fil_rev_8_21_14_0_20_42_13]|uniref:ATP synthase F1 subunit epsilon n=1 Tax=Candidatus Ghiorseimicrobium undicola TaxID=1974746 RepID=A0A2H0LW07_9BACT|nr:MAG: ATP synthase F1 subunit epsilon [Candidatus Omnitrophica bacterium CG11_big_fil_rev_8_21_14_0_20_42_13]